MKLPSVCRNTTGPLILLAKIENKQFPESKKVSPEAIINTLLENLEDLIRSKKLEVVKQLLPDVTLRMNPHLAEMLIVNLVKNAVRHNVKGGKLIVELGETFLRISNTGPDLPVDKNLLSNDSTNHLHRSSLWAWDWPLFRRYVHSMVLKLTTSLRGKFIV